MGKSLRSRAVAGISLLFIALCAGTLLHFAVPLHASKSAQTPPGKPNLSSISLPLFFEPNRGQTDPRVKFLARGSGYGLFLTSDEAVLEVQQSALSNQHSAVGLQHAAVSPQLAARSPQPVTSIVRMHLEGANPAAQIAGSELLPGKSNYFVGNDPDKWRRNIPQYARVNYSAVYPGVDLVYYGNQGQLEYDFHVAPGADPKQIALKFEGAAPKLEHGDLVLSTRAGDVRFHAPNVYQQDGGKRRTIEAGFRQIASDKIGFEIGAYDHSRELVIDPVLFFSTWLGGGGESNVQVAVDAGFNIYVACSTTSTSFPIPLVNPIQSSLNGTRNLLIFKLAPPTQTTGSQVLFSTYLGGDQSDTATGVAADNAGNIYVAGWTTSTTFPTTPNAFQTGPPAVAGIHGFVSKISLLLGVENLSYSTYVAGNLGPTPGSGFDKITGLAVDKTNDAFVTGITTSTDQPNDPGNPSFPASANGFQTQSAGGAIQFFASKINTGGSGSSSMLYSTYFGGSSAPSAVNAVGGGIALDPAGNMYFTGGTNYIGGAPASPPVFFPVQNAQQECLNEAGVKGTCGNNNGNLDAFIAKINPNVVGLGGLQYSTFLGGAGNDAGLAIAVDSSSNANITGETTTDSCDHISPPACWNQPTSIPGFQTDPGGLPDAFIAKLGPLASGIYPIVYFTYIGGSNEDFGSAIAVDSTFAAHVTGSTNSSDLPITQPNNLQGPGGSVDAFVGLISTTASGRANGDYLTYLGGSGADNGTGIALDTNNTAYVAGDTQSRNFPTKNPIQLQLNGTQNAFVSQITTQSHFSYTNSTPSASPNPGDMGSQVTFTFTWVNDGQETANNVAFAGTLTGTSAGQGFTFSSATATPGGACASPTNGSLLCNVGSVPAGSNLTVTIVMVPTCTSGSVCPSSLTVGPSLIANGIVTAFPSFAVPVNDFALTPAPSPLTQTVTAGGSTSYTVSLSACTAGGTSCGPGSGATYTNSISISATVTPANSTITTTFNPTSVTISGTGPNTTSLSVATQPRPVTTGSRLRRHGVVYATWLPVGGLSLLGLGVGASRRRRRWMAGALLGLIAGIVLLQGACGSSSSNTAQTGGTPAGTYTIKITGTSGVSHLTQVQLVVN